jgi:hypothetical protein
VAVPVCLASTMVVVAAGHHYGRDEGEAQKDTVHEGFLLRIDATA